MYFSTYSKVFINFPLSNINNLTFNGNNTKEECDLIPGNICFGVYVALKMNRLKFDFKIPLLK